MIYYSLHEVGSQCVLNMGEATIRNPDLGVGHCRALKTLTCKMKRLLRVHFWVMDHACLHLVLWCLANHVLNFHTQTNWIGHETVEVPLESFWYLVYCRWYWRRRLPALHMFGFEVVLGLNPCYGMRPWQLLGVERQVALASPYIGAGARSNCSPNIGA